MLTYQEEICILKKIIAFLLSVTSLSVGAHCPTSFKAENVCLMLDQNVIFVYDHKGEHNGPYKDFLASTLLGIKSEGTPLKFSRVARGVYRIESARPLKKVEIEIMNAQKKISLKLSVD